MEFKSLYASLLVLCLGSTDAAAAGTVNQNIVAKIISYDNDTVSITLGGVNRNDDYNIYRKLAPKSSRDQYSFVRSSGTIPHLARNHETRMKVTSRYYQTV